ncbi:MAG: ATP-binding protein [Kiritimatiellae bacterium]|nr:ATP-binding protein [Kiritimatiellia bacterium]
MKKLPIGTQDFETLRRDGCLYVDKTGYIHRMLAEGRVYFLSRPRRFGKSLLVTTLKAIFEGRRDLFEGLAIAGLEYDWAPHPVLHLDFSGERTTTTQALESFLASCVREFAARQGISPRATGYTGVLRETLAALGDSGKKAAVLIDEYDKPILDHIEDPARASEMRETLKGFYTTLKAGDAHLRFVFLTGVSKFAKMSVFSGLNNLQDITLDARFAAVLGYTQGELERDFQDRIGALSEAEGSGAEACLAKIREWYNGYRFHPAAAPVYNPFSTLLLFEKSEFGNYWFETGTPTFLVKLVRESGDYAGAYDGRLVGEAALSNFEIGDIDPVTILLQTGYLTLLGREASGLYRVGYPNREVREAFRESLIQGFARVRASDAPVYREKLREALVMGDMDAFFETLRVFFANVPYDIQLKQEKYYQTIFYLVFTLLGIRIETEVRTDRGRIDAAAQTADTVFVFVFEFKLSGTAEDALEQARANEYAPKYKGQGKRVRLFGVAFDPQTRNIGEWREGGG